MDSWITTKQLLLRQDAKSLHTRNQESGELGLLAGSMDTHLVPPCIITGVKMYIYRQRPANVSRILSTYFPTIVKYHSYRPPIGLMASKDMADAFQNPHPEVPCASVRDDTIKSLADLAAIFKLKSHQAPSLVTQASPVTVVPHPIIIPLPTHILNSPMPSRRQTISQTTIHTPDTPDRHSPPRMPTGSRQLAPRNLSQDDFCGMDTAHMTIALGKNHWSQWHHANAVIHPVPSREMEYSALMRDPRLQPLWTRGFCNKCGRLFQGIRDITGTDTCFFTKLKNIPEDRKITYGKIVCDNKPHKQEKERVRLTVVGDKLDYSGDVATSTADITTFKIIINITLSTEDAAMMMMYIKNYYLGTPLPRFEYMKMLLSRFPEEIIQKYNHNAIAVDGWVYIEIRKGMYGLKQAGLLANQLLQTRLAPFGYYPARHTLGLW
jgi:hypothetical protein